MTRVAALALALLALTAALVACDSPEGDATLTATPSRTARATMSPHPGAVIVTPEPTPTSRPEREQRVRVVLIDVASGDVVDLLGPLSEFYRDDYEVMGSSVFPEFTPDGSGVWLTFRGEGVSRRFGLDGAIEREIEDAWHVLETRDGDALYFEMNGPAFTTVLVRDGSDQGIATPNAWGALSPDGRRYAAPQYVSESEGNRLVVVDLDTGEASVVDEGLGACQCDGGTGPAWSASGRYLSYPHYGVSPAEPGEDAGMWVADLATGERSRVSGIPWAFAGTWLGDAVLVNHDGRLAIREMESGAEYAPPDLDEPVHATLDPRASQLAVVTDREQPRTRVYSTQTLALLGEWPGRVADHVATERGPALVLEQAGAECSTQVVHPALPSAACLEVGGSARLSPDGRYAAVSYSNGLHVLDLEAGAQSVHFERSTTPWPYFQWNAQGTHLLIAIGFGL